MFEFQPGLMIWTTISFAIFVLLMYRFVLPPLLKVLKEREKVIADSLSEAHENQKRSEDLLASSNKKLAEAGDIARKIVDEAKAEGEGLKEGIVASSKRQADLFLVKAKEDLQNERDQMIEEIKGRTADLIVGASSKVLGKLVDQNENRRVIEESIAQWQK